MMAGGQPFNPFSSRSRNTKIKWFEADLETFYSFVENQPILTADQELKYGKALQIWLKTEQYREELGTEKHLQEVIEENDGVFEEEMSKKGKGVTYKYKVSDEELADAISCSVETLAKMKRYYDIARSRLVNSNLKLVLAVVSRYRSSSIPNAELIAEGTRGLSRAALRYDYSKGFRFATYATWYVHQAVYEYVRWRKHPAKMPSRYLQMSRKIKEFQKVFKESEHRNPTTDEIADAMQQSRFDIYKVMTMQMYPMMLCNPVAAKDSYKMEGRERTYEDFLPTKNSDPNDSAGNKDLRQDMEELMQQNLNEVERDVLRLRLGLDNGRPKAVKEVGKRFKISWKDVRNVEKEAMAKLRDCPELSDFINNYESV
jgi:RNA polymerase primary sigma factor